MYYICDIFKMAAKRLTLENISIGISFIDLLNTFVRKQWKLKSDSYKPRYRITNVRYLIQNMHVISTYPPFLKWRLDNVVPLPESEHRSRYVLQHLYI